MLLWHGIFSFPCSFDMVYFGLMLLWHGIFSFSPCSFDMVYLYIAQFSFLLRFLEERFITQWNFYLWMCNPFESAFYLVCVDTVFRHESGKLMKLGSTAREVMTGR